MRLLVTGGCGFIGSNLIREVVNHAAVEQLVNVDCLTYAGHVENVEDVAGNPNYVFERVDLRNKREVFRVVGDHGITHVLHLAAESHVDRSIGNPGDFLETNVLGTFHLLEACRAIWSADLENKRFHHVSTDEVYGSLGPTGYFTESTPYAPNSPYSATKASSDMLVRAYHRTYGLPTLITICSNNYGPFQFPEKFIPLILQSVVARKPIPVYGDGMNVRDWLFVRDHTQALWHVLQRGQTGESYNIGGWNEWTNLRIAELICDLADEMTSRTVGSSRELITFVQDRPGHDRRYAIDASKLERALGWKPVYTFENGIRETIQWYLEHQEWISRVTRPRSLDPIHSASQPK